MTIDTPMSEEELAERLRNVILRLYRQLRWQTQAAGMGAQDPILIDTIRRTPGITISELAAREHMRPPAMTEHVQRLERAGYIIRRQDDPQDRRRVGLHATRNGVLAVNRAKRHRTDWLVNRLDALPPDTIEALKIAVSALERVPGES